MTVGEKIAKYREEKGMSQEELAHILGYKSRSTINKVELGERNVPKKMIAQLSNVLGVSPLSLLVETKKKPVSDAEAKVMNGKCYVYKYVCDNEIVYIGKSDYSLMNRICSHKEEPKFRPYIKKSAIYYAEVMNPAMSTILETYLINKYKPELNISMKYAEELGIEIPEPKWELWTN